MMCNIMFSASRAGRLLAAAVLLQPAFALATEDLQLEASAPAAGREPVEHGKAATADASPVDPGALEVEVAWAPVWIEAGGARGFDAAGELELNAHHELGTGGKALAATAGVVVSLGAHRVIAAVQWAIVGQHTAETTSGLLAFKTSL